MAARFLFILVVFALAPPAHAQRLAADLSSKEVAVSNTHLTLPTILLV